MARENTVDCVLNRSLASTQPPLPQFRLMAPSQDTRLRSIRNKRPLLSLIKCLEMLLLQFANMLCTSETVDSEELGIWKSSLGSPNSKPGGQSLSPLVVEPSFNPTTYTNPLSGARY